jgi:hypothetical protein
VAGWERGAPSAVEESRDEEERCAGGAWSVEVVSMTEMMVEPGGLQFRGRRGRKKVRCDGAREADVHSWLP